MFSKVRLQAIDNTSFRNPYLVAIAKTEKRRARVAEIIFIINYCCLEGANDSMKGDAFAAGFVIRIEVTRNDAKR